TKAMRPILKLLFPGIPSGHPALEYIAANMIANFLGLGWAATPAGLSAMRELKKLEEERREKGQGVSEGSASNEMCTFLIINISSLQLIPVNIIAYRSQYGSVNPAAVIAPAMVATAISTLAAVIYCKWKDRRLN
ncbi:MAG: nucleoside recognition protein, partial [Acetivibrio ethanolgignens]